MEKTIKEIMREALVELGKIMIEAFDAGVNMEYDTRETGTDKPWITGSVTLEGWTNVGKEQQGDAYWAFQIYSSFSEDEVATKLSAIRECVQWMSKYEVGKIDAVLPRKVENNEN